MQCNITDMMSFLNLQGKHVEYCGNKNLTVSGICSLNNLKSNSLTWIKHIENYDIMQISQSRAMLIVTQHCPEKKEVLKDYNIIYCDKPKEIFFALVEKFFIKQKAVSISKTAIILTKQIGKGVNIGEYSYIGENVIIEDHVRIEHNVVIDCKAHIGQGTIIHSGTVIGTDGFGYYKTEDGTIGKVPHVGGVNIGRNVEIGANTCIDKGTIDNTVIGDNTKIDNLVHVAHNVQIGKNSYVIAHAMLGGSANLGDNVYIAPCAAVMNQMKIGENALIGMGSVVIKDVKPNDVVAGVPAKTLNKNRGKL